MSNGHPDTFNCTRDIYVENVNSVQMAALTCLTRSTPCSKKGDTKLMAASL